MLILFIKIESWMFQDNSFLPTGNWENADPYYSTPLNLRWGNASVDNYECFADKIQRKLLHYQVLKIKA